VRITAPEDTRKGTLYFDGIITSSFQDVRHHTPDWQAPFVNEKTTSHWLVLNNSWKLKLDVPLKDSLSTEEIQELKTIKDRFIELVAEKGRGYKVAKAQEVLDSYGIRTNPDGTLNGKPVYFVRYGETFINLGIADAKKTFNRNGQLLQTLNDHLLKIAVGYLNCEDQEQKRQLAEIYVTLTRHLLDQGFAAGSGQGTLHHLGYSMRNFYTAPVIMKEVLKEAGLAAQVQQAMEWFSGVG
jgi:chondroitin-sulfate-ABC endolyase/exolyase